MRLFLPQDLRLIFPKRKLLVSLLLCIFFLNNVDELDVDLDLDLDLDLDFDLAVEYLVDELCFDFDLAVEYLVDDEDALGVNVLFLMAPVFFFLV